MTPLNNDPGGGRRSVDGFESDWEVQQYSEQHQHRTRRFTGGSSGKQNGGGTEQQQQQQGGWWGPSGGQQQQQLQQEASPRSLQPGEKLRQLRSHSSAASSSKDSLENPFSHDTFTPPVGGAPPPPHGGGGGRGRLSASVTPTIFEDVFDQDVILGGEETSSFKIHAKVLDSSDDSGLTKSDSVNIFSVKADPFDDDFFA